MDAATKLISAVATLLWPLIVIATVILFRPTLKAVLESAKSRKFTLKFGGQELSMDEASEQQRNLIADLQTQLSALAQKVEGTAVPPQVAPAIAAARSTPVPSSVLWVDDNPKNNSFFVEQLTKRGVTVELALSTDEALAKLARRRYDVVISDLGRVENQRENPTAGLELLERYRKMEPDRPFVIFCSRRGALTYHDRALALGANGITSSATELSALLHLSEISA
ncbi:MAG TPA: response regulator [Longimicrobiaceae bacterium]|nr:response regulator [Longimicrobiaceae bacterium]